VAFCVALRGKRGIVAERGTSMPRKQNHKTLTFNTLRFAWRKKVAWHATTRKKIKQFLII
jgi:hypothetical protein